MELIASGILFRNPEPGYQVVNAYLPSVQELSADELICVFRRGTAFYSADGALARVRSMDGGRVWNDEGLIWDPRADARPFTYSAPFLSRLGDGSLVLVCFRVDCSGAHRPMVNPDTGGFLPTETLLLRSKDGGRTWSLPENVLIPSGLHATLAGPVVELQDGRWFLPFDRGKDYYDPNPVQAGMIGFLSQDQGKTWKESVFFADGTPQGKAHWHGRVIALQDGRLFTLLWTQDVRTGRFLGLHRSVSQPDARNWSTPEPTQLVGETSWAVEMEDGTFFATYSVRQTPPPGIRGALSADGGRTWDQTGELILWDATGRETIGISTRTVYPASHDVIAFGRPQAIRVKSGDVLVCL